jgi:hypothetical protein
VEIVRGCKGMFEPGSEGSEKKRKGGRNTIERIVTPRQRKRSQETRKTARRKSRGVGPVARKEEGATPFGGPGRNERTPKNEKKYAAFLIATLPILMPASPPSEVAAPGRRPPSRAPRRSPHLLPADAPGRHALHHRSTGPDGANITDEYDEGGNLSSDHDP